MILIITNRNDYTVDFLILGLRKRGIPHVRFNTEDFPLHASGSWAPTGGSINLEKSGRKITFSEIDGVYYRRPARPIIPKDMDSDTTDFIVRESGEFLSGLWRYLDCRWVNHPDQIRLAESKIEQLSRMRKMGIEIPETMITNDSQVARKFYEENRGDIVAKTLRASQSRSEDKSWIIYTNHVSEESLELLDTVKLSPVIFQSRVQKVSDIRVNVVGTKVFATEIFSQEMEATRVDWRRDTLSLKHEIHTLPARIEDQCRNLVGSYGLVFGALDLVRTKESDYVFLELNPNGQWAWIEALTGQPISNTLIDELTS